MLKRWNWDSNGDINNNMNMLYALFYFVVVIIGFPIVITIIYCRNRKVLDKKRFRDYAGGSFEGMRKSHKNRNILYNVYYLFRRFVFLLLVVVFEDNF